MQLLFEGGVNLKVLLDTTKNCFSHDIVICGIKLTEYMSFDFDYNGAVAPRAIALVCLKSLDSTWQENLKPKE